MLRIVDLGCGRNKQPGALGVDIHQFDGVDRVIDLEKVPWELPSNQFDVVYMLQVLEHLQNPAEVMLELYRICAPGALVFIQVPNGYCDGFAQDPTHKKAWNLGTFIYFAGPEQWPGEWNEKYYDFGTHFRILHREWMDSDAKYAHPALLVTHTRSGSTFLNYALSTHPRIFWARGEPLLQGMEWRTTFPCASDADILDCITRASFYKIGGCKVTYEQFGPAVMMWARRNPSVKILHLTRENLIRVAVSQIITGRVVAGKLDGTAHAFERPGVHKLAINPDDIVTRAAWQEEQIGKMRVILDWLGVHVLELTYNEIVGGVVEASEINPGAAHKICEFLGVEDAPLRCDLRRVNYAPLSEIIDNWDEVKCAIGDTKYAKFLEGEY